MLVQGIILVILALALVVLGNLNGRNNQKTTSARWADKWDKLNALRKAKKQLKSKKIDDICLWCGAFERKELRGLNAEIKLLLSGKNADYLFN